LSPAELHNRYVILYKARAGREVALRQLHVRSILCAKTAGLRCSQRFCRLYSGEQYLSLRAFQRPIHPRRLRRPSAINIPARESHTTSSTPFRLHRALLRTRTATTLSEYLLFECPPPNQIPKFAPDQKLPHRTGSDSLPLAEEGSSRPRQVVHGAVCYRFRPP
jgi:hypothetical protein